MWGDGTVGWLNRQENEREVKYIKLDDRSDHCTIVVPVYRQVGSQSLLVKGGFRFGEGSGAFLTLAPIHRELHATLPALRRAVDMRQRCAS